MGKMRLPTKSIKFTAIIGILTFSLFFMFNNCSEDVRFSGPNTKTVGGDNGTTANNDGNTTPPPAEPPTNPNEPPMPPTEPPPIAVCDPFSENNEVVTEKNGIEGKLYYFDSQPPTKNTSYFLQYGTYVENLIVYLSQINVPTRHFSQGFTTDTGATLSNLAGDTLIEWFALNLTGRIGLTSADAPGAYQFAAISDDGILFKLTKNGTLEPYINDDNVHPTLMSCSVEPVMFDATTKIPFELNYFQGPRTEIALMLLWRPYPAAGGAPIIDPECGKSGTTYFFDYSTNPSTPKQPYLNLLSRGWRPVPAVNFFLKENAKPNPCTE